ncbi:Uncharacterised protein [Mesomycoplasma dispar]|uniref:Uncharacterized protein n=1 Tax=Mesomycoplasma dispar TaxID=86660 RepID=A0AAJ5NKR6_9BACT|nr:hypothetical protein [Mesomycoplasma dispar]AJR11961.1 hypothetical protein MDIS_00435 [Mesomycoplasma dispar]ATP59437.1 hypothetical protein CSW10_00430 [Mesomycoplasma dispar]VEU61244.1 Uncharacterised protein [Mesomycoplasma dispar]
MKTSPFYSGIRVIDLPQSVLISLSVIFFVLAIISISFHKYTRKKIKEYKELQMEDWRKENPTKKHLSYEKTGMYLPAWQRAKYNLHIILCLVFLVGGFVFAFGNTLTTL